MEVAEPPLFACGDITDQQQSEQPHHREGHRPLVTPAVALSLAWQLFGLAPVAASASCSATELCIELPSYDDRNFLIVLDGGGSGSSSGNGSGNGCSSSSAGAGAGVASSVDAADGGGGGDRGGGGVGGGGSEAGRWGRVVLKIHNSRDNGRRAQLQAMDEAMLRLAAAGVATNTPMQPCPPPPPVPAPAPPASSQQQEQARPRQCNCGGSGSGSGGQAVHVPCLVAAAPPPGGPGATAAANTNTADSYGYGSSSNGADADVGAIGATGARAGVAGLSGWAWLPCTCCSGGAAEAEVAEAAAEHYHWHAVRCLSYVPGRMMSAVTHLTPGLLVSLGELLGRVTCGLSGWRPPALQGATHDWHPQMGAAVLRRLVPHIHAFEPERKLLLLRAAADLEAAADMLSDPQQLPRQVCHADANDDNVVITGPDSAAQAAGVIDFGDMSEMPRVCEVAISSLYAMLLALQRPMRPPLRTPKEAAAFLGGQQHGQQQGQQGGTVEDAVPGAALDAGVEVVEEESDEALLLRLLSAAGLILAGYSRHVVLQPSELSALPLLLRARLAQSLALGAASVVADPGNAPYLLMTQGPGWRVIRLLQPGALMSQSELLGALLRAARLQ